MVNSALGMAVAARRPAEGTTLHSDHGPQYTAWAFSQKIRAEGLVHSLGTIRDAFADPRPTSPHAQIRSTEKGQIGRQKIFDGLLERLNEQAS